MHHDKNGSGHSAMMWMMVLCCALPLIILLLGGTTVSFGGYLLPLIMSVLMMAHFWMMFRSHGHERSDSDVAPHLDSDDGSKKGGSCH